MSERLKSTSQFTNEEIIDDLTKDIKNSARFEENPEEFVINPSTTTDEGPTSRIESGDAAKMSDIPRTDQPEESLLNESESEDDPDIVEEQNEDATVSDSESIDEEELKNLEITLTGAKMEERRRLIEELKEQGNYAYSTGDYSCGIDKYSTALKNCPLVYPQLRAKLFCNRSAIRMKQDEFEKAIKDCTKALELDDTYLKAYMRRAQAYEYTDKLDESLADWKKVLELQLDNRDAKQALLRLPPLIEEKNEKLKTEMLGKLKDLGNMFLRPFGLSTENFQMEQDPESKGYKINFKQ